MITGTSFVDLPATYNRVNHKLYNTTRDNTHCRVIYNLLSNRRFYVEMNNERSRWILRKNGLTQRSDLSPTLFNIYTNVQPIHDGTRSFIYADDLVITAQYPTFLKIENTIKEALGELTKYYKTNSLRSNPEKTQSTAFYLRNRDAEISMSIAWNGIDPENTPHLKYTLDRTLSYNQYIQNKKMKVATHNNLLKKLENYKWGTNANTIRTTALSLFSSPGIRTEPSMSIDHWMPQAYNGNISCECELATEHTGYMLQCTLLTHPCTPDDLRMLNGTGKRCAERWKKSMTHP